MHCLLRFAHAAAAAALAIALASTSHAEEYELQSEAPDAAFFEKNPGRTWLSHCEYQSDRYVVCKFAAPEVIAAIESPKTTAGAAMQDLMRGLFEAKGCTFDAPPETFRVNGIFLSFDMEGGKKITCQDQPSQLVFAPGVITFLDTVYFLNDGRPR